MCLNNNSHFTSSLCICLIRFAIEVRHFHYLSINVCLARGRSGTYQHYHHVLPVTFLNAGHDGPVTVSIAGNEVFCRDCWVTFLYVYQAKVFLSFITNISSETKKY